VTVLTAALVLLRTKFALGKDPPPSEKRRAEVLRVAVFTRKGNGYTKCFPAIRDSLVSLPVRSAIIDAEIVVCDSDGKPDFKALMEGAPGSIRQTTTFFASPRHFLIP
jgi:hypothetical protein